VKTKIIVNFSVAALLLAGTAWAKTATPPLTGNDAIVRGVTHQILMYPYYTLFDQVDFQLNDGTVRLVGEVTQPWKKSALGERVAGVKGVTAVENELKVAPLSTFDDRIRMQVVRGIYRDPALSRYGVQAIPPIHIIVDNGHVTLEGIVNTEMEKEIAGIRANSSMSFGTVTNNLRVERPAPPKS
jgi:hyperosmotically inducible protein